jgi:hypothetical protein
VRASGRGTVYSFTVTHQNQAPGFREELPYVLAIVELEEGVRHDDERRRMRARRGSHRHGGRGVFDDVTPRSRCRKFRPSLSASRALSLLTP